MENEIYKKPSFMHYHIFKIGSHFISKFFFKCKVLRNETKKEKGPFVIIANHECALDFSNVIPYVKKRITMVMSKAYHDTMKTVSFMKNLHAIYKNQFITSMLDIKKMFGVIKNKGVLLLYPAGLMTDNGLNTYIPHSTFKFLKKLNANVYVARTKNSYFVKPKWGKGIRSGKSTIDIYKLYDKSGLEDLSISQIEQDVNKALSFDAYRENEALGFSSKKWQNVEGLNNVLYKCPHCKSEFTITSNENTLYCTNCGYTVTADSMGLFSGENLVYKYPTDWYKFIYDEQVKEIESTKNYSLSHKVSILLIDKEKHEFVERGKGTLFLTSDGFSLNGEVNGENFSKHFDLYAPITPFVPGKQIDLQEDCDTIIRVVFDDGRFVPKYMLTLRYFFEKKANSQEKNLQ